MANILIAENDSSLNSILSLHLSKMGHKCKNCHSIQKAFKLLEKENFDIVVLDRILNDGDGIEISSYLHDLGATTRILFISDLGSVKDRILGLEQGGDDYLPKPFSIVEFGLKIKKMVGTSKNTNTTFTINNIVLDPSACSLKLPNSELVFLRQKETKILSVLMRHKNQVVSRDQIISNVWGSVENIPSYVTIDAYVRKIRMKIKSCSTKITTHRGIGYRIS